ncbi:MAG: hypothetical protein V1725_06710 [archaeon]
MKKWQDRTLFAGIGAVALTAVYLTYKALFGPDLVWQCERTGPREEPSQKVTTVQGATFNGKYAFAGGNWGTSSIEYMVNDALNDFEQRSMPEQAGINPDTVRKIRIEVYK